ncbi:TfoX/Sxy family protein [Microlunatus sp. Y2014]|uniref:TfoX/Sxy family protein n=1 Tax=Microlunatus sp. Y2014 TaxID=3418488 RepID=UPI003DA6EA65
MKPEQAALVERLREALAAEEPREVNMFGGRSFMVDDQMVVHARNNGALLVRVSPERDPDLVDAHGATRAEMGAGRSMGVGWISVEADAIAGDEELAAWVDAALDRIR